MNKYESSPAVTKFRKQLKSHFSESSPHFICGVSGGIDSMSLLYLLHRHNITTTVVHCNYGLRGEESDQDQEFVEQICSLWNIDCVTASFDPENRNQNNIQAWARDLRYQVFRDMMHELQADAIITAHHQDDQVETIMQKILRGAGINSWKGMDVLDGDLFRPLLNLSKTEIEEFAKENEIPFREDESNIKPDYARNFIRITWAPKLDELFPGWRQNILKIPERAEEADLLAAELLKHLMTDDHLLDRNQFLALDKKIRPFILAEFIKINAPEISISTGFLMDSESLENLQTGAGISISEDLQLIRNRDYFLVQKVSERKRSIWVIEKEDLQNNTEQIENFSFTEKEWDQNIPEKDLIIDSDKITWPVSVRNWKDGDRIRPFGMEGSQLVSDLLTNNKIDSSQKKSAKVVQSFDENISAVIFPHVTNEGRTGVISELYKCTDKTQRILKIIRHST